MTVITVVVGRSGRREVQRGAKLSAEDMAVGNTPVKNRLSTGEKVSKLNTHLW